MKLQKLNRTLLGALVALGAVGAASQAHALNITPSTVPQYLENTITANLDATQVTAIATANFGFSGTLALVYKQDFGGGESGNGAPYYSTSFDPELSLGDGPSAGAVTWVGPMKISCPSCYLVVKDGSNIPKQYVFDISNSWNGTDTINLSGFWANTNGAISNIAIWNKAVEGGGTIAMVPEADTYAMLLAGLGLVGFAARRTLSKTV